MDIAIAGGGPAGTIAAILLARAGARVTLAEVGGRGAWAEGAGLRLVAALRAQRLAVEGLGPLVERRVDWGTLSGQPNREHMLSRPAFDEGLQAQAVVEGVTLVRAPVRRVRRGVLELADGREIAAGLVIEARGRRAPVAEGRLRGIPTVSIAAEAGASAAGAEVRALPEGWLWRIGDGARGWMQVTVDAAAARDPAAVWAAMTGFAPRGLVVRGAELRLSAPDLDPAMPRIGDAAVAMDPLSGHGMFWALASALMAVPLCAALLDGQGGLAARFYRDRVVATFDRQARVGRDFYRAAGMGGRFWRARAGWPDEMSAEPVPPAAPHLENRVIVRAGRLAEAQVLVTPQDPEGAAFVGGVEIAPLLARLGRGPMPDRAGFAARVLPETPPETAGRIYDWLAARGITTAPALKNKEVVT
ncbi:flavin-dependent monooxygenase QhpG [Maliponia aquimaris]|uniref:Uncharacterized protein n=1 Tax=Maliponia aquimaris TaxID=1673631 RepID=A0A238K7I2_9RHOB|nr:hypothetical protein [Maliponia aquimaris]SMX38765.1 hypothetical protein MAA8898_01708 [Maliponia aquimaris]